MPAKVASAPAASSSAPVKSVSRTRSTATRSAASASASTTARAAATMTTTSTSRAARPNPTMAKTASSSSTSSGRSTATRATVASTRASSVATSTSSAGAATSASTSKSSAKGAKTTVSSTATVRGVRSRTAMAPPTTKASAALRQPVTAVEQTWTEADVLEALKTPKAFPTALPHYVLLLLGTTAEALSLDGELGACVTFATAPEKLPAARCVYFSKQLVNAGLSFLSELTSSGWSIKASTVASEPTHVRAAVAVFRIAARSLLLPSGASIAKSVGKQRELEVETVILRTCSKLRAIGLPKAARADCLYLENLCARCEDSNSDVNAGARTLLLPSFSLPGDPTSEPSPARISFVVDLQCNSTAHALEEANLSSLDSILADLNHAHGPLAWQLYGRQHGGEVRVLDRVAFATERAISKALQRLEAPNSQEHLPLRTLALQMLVQVSDIDLAALWERVARTGGAVLKQAQKDGDDIASAYHAVQDAFNTVVETAATVAENSEVKDKTLCDGFQQFCEHWLSFARKAGSAVGVDRATALLTGAATSQHSSGSSGSPSVRNDEDLSDSCTPRISTSGRPSPRAEMSDMDIAKFCATLTGSVLALDKVLVGNSEQDTQAKLDHAAELLAQQVGTWPAAAAISMSSQLKFYRVVDQLHRRCCTKLGHQGSDSKGEPKPDTTGAANVDRLSRACLRILRSLFECPDPSLSTSPSSANRASDLTPPRTVALPTKDACLADIVYGQRVLANKLFSVRSRSARDEARNELEQCLSLLQSNGAQSVSRKVMSEQFRLLSTSFYNPAGILYNAANYVEAASLLQLAVDCDAESIRFLHDSEGQLSQTEQHELQTTLKKRQEALSKKLEYTAAAYRFAGSKPEALRCYRQLLLSLASCAQEQLDQCIGSVSIDEYFKLGESKGLANTIKAIVDLSLQEPSSDTSLDDPGHGLTSRLLQNTELEPSVKGAILELAATLLNARSHMSGSARAIYLIEQAMLQIYDSVAFPLRRARVLAKRLERDVLSHALLLSEDEVIQLEADATACLDCPSSGRDEGLRHFRSQYRCSVLLSAALHARLRKPFDDPQAVTDKVEIACKALTSSTTPLSRPAPLTTPQRARGSPRTAAARTQTTTAAPNAASRRVAAPSTRTTTTRKPLAQRSAPPQAAASPSTDPATPPSKSSKPTFEAEAEAVPCKSPKTSTAAGARGLDHMEHFCNSLLNFHEAFAALALTRCSIQILKAVRQVTRQGTEIVPGLEEVFCRASADLAQAYLDLGKVNRAEVVLQPALRALSKHAPPDSPSGKLILVSQDVRYRCWMARVEISCQECDHVAAQARFAEGLKLAKQPSKGDKQSTSSLDRLRQRERQAIAFSVCARVQMARGDLTSSIESITSALRQLIRLSANLSHIATKTYILEQEGTRTVHSDAHAPSSDALLETQEEQQRQTQGLQQLPKFCGTTLSGLFWRCCHRLFNSYMQLSRLHSIRGSAIDAEAMAGEGIDFATSLQFALPLARALIHRGELRFQLNRTEQGQEDLSRCLEILQNTWIPEVVSLSYVQGDCLMRIEQLAEAYRSYIAGEATLRSLSIDFGDVEQIMPSPKAQTHHRRTSSVASLASQIRARISDGNRRDVVLPELQTRLVQRQAWTLHLMGNLEESEEALEKAATVRDGLATVDARVNQFVLEGSISLRRALEHLRGDHFFSMLPEAAISIPMVPSVSVRTLVSAAALHQTNSEDTVKTALGMLTPAESAFREALSLGLMSSHSLVLREAFASLAQVYTIQAALGKNVRMAANAAASLLDWASSIGVRRNVLMSIPAKLRSPTALLEDHDWPTLANDEPQGAGAADSMRGPDVKLDGSDDEEALPTRLAKLTLNKRARRSIEKSAPTINPLSAFWQSVRLRHQQAQHEPGTANYILPRNWTVISISVRKAEVENLILTRQDGGGGCDGCDAKEAVLYSLPMNRRSQRDGTEEEEEQLTLQAAQEKLESIVRLSNDGIHGVKDVQSMDARRKWWTERHRLDDELRDMLQAIQDTWFGGFKGVFSEPTSDARAMSALRVRFEKIVRRACFPTANKRPSKLKLDDAVFECFAGLPADCTDEDLEDLVHYVMDALQFSGFQVAVDEIDLDETAMDLRGALEEFHGKKAQASPNKTSMAYVAVDEEETVQDHHIFLVLDKDTSVFPWESMPILRGKAVSRIPSMAFLQDRIEMAKVFCHRPADEQDDAELDEFEVGPLQRGKQAARSRSRSPSKSSRPLKDSVVAGRSGQQNDGHDGVATDSAWQVALRNGKLFRLSKRKTFYLLNPGGDLVQSQERFEPWLKGRGSTHGWKGIVGRQPIVDELPNALSSSDLVLYFGHGGAEQFIRQSKVRELQRCAVAMLWGCSSAMLHNNGDFDRTGTPLNYMCAGAPAMVGNLWDMTDRELDSVCEGVFSRLGLMEKRELVEVKPAARNIKLDRSGNPEASRASGEMSLARAIAESRNDCKLPYLTGAATVVYGVPVYWDDSND